jgi:hypothetical protein
MKKTTEELFALTPAPGHEINATACQEGLKAGDVVYVNGWVHYCGEKDQPQGLAVTFTRYVYDRPIWHFPIRKYAMFRFPDGSERSIMKGSITRSRIRALLSRTRKDGVWRKKVSSFMNRLARNILKA